MVSESTREEMKADHADATGRKFNTLLITYNNDGEENRVKLSSNEHKKSNADDDLIFEQQSKNIITNICIMSQLKETI